METGFAFQYYFHLTTKINGAKELQNYKSVEVCSLVSAVWR